MLKMSLNRRLSRNVASYFSHGTNTVSDRYPDIVGGYSDDGRIIVDVGGGAQCAFAKQCASSHVIAVDISAVELEKNRDVNDRRIADVTKRIPVTDDSADVIASRFVVEHLRGVDHFVEEAYRALKPGGVFITLFPNKYALFSLINRCLPASLARKLAYLLKGGAQEFGIFPAYYEYCSPTSFRRLCQSKRFAPVEVDVMYFQSSYYYFFFPFALLSLCYEWLISRLRITSLCAHVLICAYKPTIEVTEGAGTDNTLAKDNADCIAHQ